MKSTDLEDQQQQSLRDDTLSLYLDTAYLILIFFYIIHETIRCNVWHICMYRSTQTQALSPCKKKSVLEWNVAGLVVKNNKIRICTFLLRAKRNKYK